MACLGWLNSWCCFTHYLFTFPYFCTFTPQVQDGCVQQPANAFWADNLGILCVWYTYHTAAQLPRCASNIYFKKEKKKKQTTPQTLPNLFPPQPSLLKLLTSLSTGNSWDAVLFMYFFLAASLLQHPKKGAKTFEEIIHKRLPCMPIHSALAMCWWLMDSHIPCHCWLHSGHPTNICVLLAWGHSYLRRGQGKDPPSTKAFWSETHRKSTRSSVFVAPSRGEKSWENDTISELLLLSEMLNIDCQNPTVWTGFGFSLTDCRAHLQVWQVAMYLLVDNFGE